MDNQKNNNKKLSKVLSTKLSIEDYNAFLTLTELEYEDGLIKEESTSELLRFTICRLLSHLRNNRVYHLLEQQQKQVQNNQQQQQFHNQYSSQSTTNAAAHHQQQFLIHIRERI